MKFPEDFSFSLRAFIKSNLVLEELSLMFITFTATLENPSASNAAFAIFPILLRLKDHLANFIHPLMSATT